MCRLASLKICAGSILLLTMGSLRLLLCLHHPSITYLHMRRCGSMRHNVWSTHGMRVIACTVCTAVCCAQQTHVSECLRASRPSTAWFTGGSAPRGRSCGSTPSPFTYTTIYYLKGGSTVQRILMCTHYIYVWTRAYTQCLLFVLVA